MSAHTFASLRENICGAPTHATSAMQRSKGWVTAEPSHTDEDNGGAHDGEDGFGNRD